LLIAHSDPTRKEKEKGKGDEGYNRSRRVPAGKAKKLKSGKLKRDASDQYLEADHGRTPAIPVF